MTAYVTLVEADIYFTQRLHETAWSQATGADKPKSLDAATSIIDSLSYKGAKRAVCALLESNPDATLAEKRAASETQENEFPRGTDTITPDAIKTATYEIAYALLDGVDPELELENMSINDHGIGSVRASYNRDQTPLEYFMNGIPSAAAWKYLKPFLRDDNHLRMVRV